MSDKASLPGYGIIRVPANAVATYKSANVWKEPEIASRIISIDDKIDYNVVTTAQNSGNPGLAKVVADEDMLKVVSLKVSGTINSYDIIVMNNWMPNLRWLDLSDATIETCNHEYYTGYKSQDCIVGNRMFYDQDEYVSIKLPKNTKGISSEAFRNSSNLKEVTMYEGIKSIGSNAFFDCGALTEIDIPKGCETIGSNAFYSCKKLTKAIIGEGCETIGSSAFFYCQSLETLSLPTTLKRIYDYAFKSCSSLKKISLPVQLNSIGSEAFSSCSALEELRIPSSVMSIGNGAFAYCSKLKDIYTYTIEPTKIIQETFTNYQTATLHVPYTSRAIYRINTEWSQFLQAGEFDVIKEPYEYFYINNDYVLDDQTGVVPGKPNCDFMPGSGFIHHGHNHQNMGHIHIKHDGNCSGSIIGNGNIDADDLSFDITITAGKWYFFSFPFKVNLSDITCPGQHVWRKYDGQKRAQNGQGGWTDLGANEDHLKKGQGYIFQASKGGTLTVKIKKDNFGYFAHEDHKQTVNEYTASEENNASWNFLGNPHTSYFNIEDMGYQAPITVWTGSSYEALRPGDDDYYLQPFQAFFVQKPVGTNEINFKADNKVTHQQAQLELQRAKARRLTRGINRERLLINLTLGDGTHTDKTRVVFNDKQSVDYEMECDAAKFMSTEEIPQLYSLDGKQTLYAINERPTGDVPLGICIKKAGEYTIAATRMDTPVLLRDTKTGITFDLSNGDYTFQSEAGTFNARFVLAVNKNATGIADIQEKTGVSIAAVAGGININGLNGQTVYVYDTNGRAVATETIDGTISLKPATYVVKVDGLATKVLVK